MSRTTPDSGVLTTQTASPTQAPPADDRRWRAAIGPGDDATRTFDPSRYRILGEHGRGARGSVSRAHDRSLGRDIAIKELISRGDLDEVRFLREALITARLEHPGIVPVYEAGRWPDGTPFYAMKLVAGRALSEILAERTTIDERLPLLHHVIAVTDAIAYAHGRNIIHRDLKPANILVGEFGETVVIDWGLAKDLTVPEVATAGDASPTALDDGLTATGSVMGTPAYMPPEQRRGAAVDRRADVFAIGAMLWELCALQRTPPTSAAQRRRILRRAGIERDLIAIIDKAVDPEPACRYPDAGALASDLKAFKAGARISARDYSLLAMLVHWTLRHRALAATVAAALIVLIAGGVDYVRSIAAERDRADQERDRARLSEASAVLERDPTRARDLLAALTARSPQYALLMSQARQGAAARVLSEPAGVAGMFRAPGATELALLTQTGEFYRLDPRTGTRRLIDREVGGAVTYHAGDWLYVRKPFDTSALSIATPSTRDVFNARGLTGVSRLVSMRDSVYAVDAQNDLYRLSRDAPVLVRRDVHRVAGAGSWLLVCSQDGTLEGLHDGSVMFHDRCLRDLSPGTMAVRGDDYATVTDRGVLIASRAGRVLELPTAISGEYELALSSTGVVAVADYEHGSSTWFIRPGAAAIERSPVHPGPMAVAADGRYAAWGYRDGTLIVVDTLSGPSWELKGHSDPITDLAIDADHATLTSYSRRELRVWDLTPPPITPVRDVPCRALDLQPSLDGSTVALACTDGSVSVWSRRTGTVTRLHQHHGQALGVRWLGSFVCSGSWDGKVLCTTTDGRATRTYDPRSGRVTRFTGSPDARVIVFTTADGRIWKLDGELHPLYSQDKIFQLAISSDARLLASCGVGGSLVVFDLVDNRVVSRVTAHRTAAMSVAWWSRTLLSSGSDGLMRQWSISSDRVQLQGQVQEAAPVHSVQAFADGWVYASAGTLSIDRLGRAPVRLELARPIQWVIVSPDMRYVAASVTGKVVVLDVRANRLATLAIETTSDTTFNFLDASSLAVVSDAGLAVIHVDAMSYEPF
ncbi:MAG TPA: serine/threonine-protein kinase [Kofleriaceae bacterium]|jgi:WD40 repeat protein|nr:serine/threonine-protein kinase [Kofleriaceae bacterium]